MSPKGVEHSFSAPTTSIRITCIHQCRRKALSTSRIHDAIRTATVHPSMSPKGVEHLLLKVVFVVMLMCIHQCRRKALSTRVRSQD